MTGGGGRDVLPVVDENEELGVATGGTEMFHDLDSGAPGFQGEVAHVVMVGDEVPRCFVIDVGGDAGDEVASVTVVDEGKVTGHDGDGAFDREEVGDDGVDDV